MELQVYSNTQLNTLERIKKNIRTRTPIILEGIGVYMVSSVVENFELQGRPEKWQKNAPATIAAKERKKKGNLILHENALLKLGITHEVDLDESTVQIGPSGPSIVYSRIQQKGGEAGWNYSVTIPARPYLVFQEENKMWISKFIRNEVFYAGN